MRPRFASLSPQYSPLPPMPCSSHTNSQNSAHLVTARPVEEISWRQKARGRKKGRRGGGEETMPQQVINNSAAVQQER
jgi:hypothetical protein